MKKNFKIKLDFSLVDCGRSARDIIELYSNQVRDDIDQAAWNLCDCDDQVQNDNFADLTLLRWTVQEGDEVLHVQAQFTVNTLNKEFILQVVEQYMHSFAYYIASTKNGYYSRTGNRALMNFNPLEWEVEIE